MTIGELIDILEHFDPELRVEIVYESFAHRDIVDVRQGTTEHDPPGPIVQLEADNL